MPDVDLRDDLRTGLRRHPRVAYQGFFEDPAACARLAETLPRFIPFGGAAYQGALWVLDWDHRLPSQTLILRLHAYYDAVSHQKGLAAFEGVAQRIDREYVYPEFDVVDFAGLPADEFYEVAIDPDDGTLDQPPKLLSDWRRVIDPDVSRKVIDVVRKSSQFAGLKRSPKMKDRPLGLGDLEAAEWSPPCETGHNRWGVDVWFLLAFNGVVGEGCAFLVDPVDHVVVRQREFQFRAG